MAHFPVPRLRVLYGSAIALGPGKAELLEAIGRTGSIAAAARRPFLADAPPAWQTVSPSTPGPRSPR